jgi:hypothetical protein
MFHGQSYDTFRDCERASMAFKLGCSRADVLDEHEIVGK